MLRPLVAALVAVIVTAAALSSAVPAQASPATDPAPGSSVKGTWIGIVNDDTGATKPYQVTVQIKRSKKNGDLKGTVVYPYCSGVWVFRKSVNGYRVFQEQITTDPGVKSCVSKLRVKVRRTRAGGLYVRWIFHQRTDHMIAQRAT